MSVDTLVQMKPNLEVCTGKRTDVPLKELLVLIAVVLAAGNMNCSQFSTNPPMHHCLHLLNAAM